MVYRSSNLEGGVAADLLSKLRAWFKATHPRVVGRVLAVLRAEIAGIVVFVEAVPDETREGLVEVHGRGRCRTEYVVERTVVGLQKVIGSCGKINDHLFGSNHHPLEEPFIPPKKREPIASVGTFQVGKDILIAVLPALADTVTKIQTQREDFGLGTGANRGIPGTGATDVRT